MKLLYKSILIVLITIFLSSLAAALQPARWFGTLNQGTSVLPYDSSNGSAIENYTYPSFDNETYDYSINVWLESGAFVFFKVDGKLADQSPSAWVQGQFTNLDLTVTDSDNDNYSVGYPGYTGSDKDCNDTNVNIHPGATEQCNGIDDDCDGVIDNGLGLDEDSDLVCGNNDNCPTNANSNQLDTDNDNIGDVCDADADGDNVDDSTDNCILVNNPNQADIDNDEIGDECDDDIDGDGILNPSDFITGNSTHIKTNVPNLYFSVGGTSNPYNQNGVASVSFNKNDTNNTLLVFDYNFSTDTLDLRNVNITVNQDSSKGSVIISGINSSALASKKTVYIDRIVGSNSLCIFDSEGLVTLTVNNDCSNGVKLTCDGISGQYNCTTVGSKYKVEGLTHSGVTEYSYSAPSISGTGAGGGGGGGGSSGCITNWVCGEWGSCVGGRQSRICTDSNNCGTISGRPQIERACLVSPGITTTPESTEPVVQGTSTTGETPAETTEQTTASEATVQTTPTFVNRITGFFLGQGGNSKGRIFAFGALVLVVVAALWLVYRKKNKNKVIQEKTF